MTELEYAISCGVKLNTKELSDGTFQVSWNDGKCVEIINKEDAEKLNLLQSGNDYTFIMNSLPSGSKKSDALRLIGFIDKYNIGKVYDCELDFRNGDIVGIVRGTMGTVSLNQHTVNSSNGKQFFRIKATKH